MHGSSGHWSKAKISPVVLDTDLEDAGLEVQPPFVGGGCQAEDVLLDLDELPRDESGEACRRLVKKQVFTSRQVAARQEGALYVASSDRPSVFLAQSFGQQLHQACKPGPRQRGSIRVEVLDP